MKHMMAGFIQTTVLLLAGAQALAQEPSDVAPPSNQIAAQNYTCQIYTYKVVCRNPPKAGLSNYQRCNYSNTRKLASRTVKMSEVTSDLNETLQNCREIAMQMEKPFCAHRGIDLVYTQYYIVGRIHNVRYTDTPGCIDK